MPSFIFHYNLGKLSVLSPNRKASFGKPRQFLQNKNISFLLYIIFYCGPRALGTLCHLTWEKKYFSGTCSVYECSLYVNMKYEKKPGKEERATVLKDQIIIKEKSSKGRKSILLVIATQWNISPRHKNTSCGLPWPQGALHPQLVFSPLRSFQHFYHHYYF